MTRQSRSRESCGASSFRELADLEVISVHVRALADPPREAAQLDAPLETYIGR